MKPSFLTYATLIRQFQGVEGGAIKLPYSDKNVRLYLWQRGKERLLTAWTIEGAGQLALSLGRATVTDAFGYRQTLDLAKGLRLSAFPVYIEGMTDARPVEALQDQLRQEETRQQESRKRLARAEAYLFKFGGSAEGLTLDIGRERPYISVLADEIFTQAKGYGFAPGFAVENQERKWIRSDLDRTSCKITKENEFRLRTKPGRYQLRLGVSPYGDAHLLLRGAAGGDKRLPVATKGDSIVEATVETTEAVLSLSVDNYAMLRWLTLIEQLPVQEK